MIDTTERHPPHVYFVESLKTGLIKIGYSHQIGIRLKSLKVEHHDLILLAVTEGSRAREAEIHADLDRFLIDGEWFAPSPLLLEYIAVNGSRLGDYSPPDESLWNEDVFEFGGETYYRLHEVTERTGASRATINRLIHDHQIPLTRAGPTKLLNERSLQLLEAAIRDHTSKPTDPDLALSR